MSALLWIILIVAFMFFMHRGGGHGAMGGGMGCCGGGHMQGSQDHNHDSAHEHEHKPDIASIKEAEYVEVTDDPVKEVSAHHEEEYVDTHAHISRSHVH